MTPDIAAPHRARQPTARRRRRHASPVPWRAHWFRPTIWISSTPLRSGADLRGRVVSVTPGAVPSRQPFAREGMAGHIPGQYIPDRGRRRPPVARLLAHPRRAPPTGSSITTRPSRTAKVRRASPLSPAAPGTLVHLDQATGDLPAVAPCQGPLRHRRLGHHPGPQMLRNRLARPPGRHPRPHLPSATPRSSPPNSGRMPRALAPSARHTAIVGAPRRHRRHTRPGPRPRRLVPDWRRRRPVCGPTGLLDSARIPAGDSRTPISSRRALSPDHHPGGEGGEITFLRTDVSVDADGTHSDRRGEEAGVLMPSGCRMGICFGCVVTMQGGRVRDLRTGEVTIAEPVTNSPSDLHQRRRRHLRPRPLTSTPPKVHWVTFGLEQTTRQNPPIVRAFCTGKEPSA